MTAAAPLDEGNHRLAGNAAWLLTAELVSKLVSIVFVVIVARALGVRDYGFFTFAVAFVTLFLAVGSAGLSASVVRAVSLRRERLQEVFASGLLARAATGVAALAVCLAVAPLFLRDRVALITTALVGTALLLDSLTNHVSTVFEVYERNRHYATTLVVNRVGSTALVLVVYLAGGGLAAILACYLAGSALALGFAVRTLRRNFPRLPVRAARRSTAVELFRAGAPLGVASVINMALLRIDTVMVAALLDAEAVGLYGVAFRFYESFLFLAYALGDASFPRLVKQGRDDASRRVLQATTTATLCAYVPFGVLMLFSAGWVVEVVFGARYAGAATAVPWLVLATALFGLTFQLRMAAIALGRSGGVARTAAVTLAVNVGLNLVLIPSYGIAGAAAGTAVASAVELVLTWATVRRAGLVVRPHPLLLAPVVAGALVAGLLWALDLRDGAALLVGTGAYLAAIGVAVAVAPRDQRRRAVELLRGRAA